MTDNYVEYQKKKYEEHHSLCKRCGTCCGAGWDPCVNLIKQADNTYLCKSYDNRLGPQMTASGSIFTCVEIRDHINKDYSIPNCPYFR